VQALNPGRVQSRLAPKKYGDELCALVTRMPLDVIAAEGQRIAAIRQVTG